MGIFVANDLSGMGNRGGDALPVVLLVGRIEAAP
jgi:hypothetical protein